MPQQKAPANGQPKTSQEFLAVLSKFLAIYAEHYQREVSPLNAQVYELGLADLAPAELERACSLALTCLAARNSSRRLAGRDPKPSHAASVGSP